MSDQKDRLLQSADGSEVFARYDLRLRSLDRKPDEPINLCCADGCDETADWSVWLHTPEWGAGNAGATHVRCHHHALLVLEIEALTAVSLPSSRHVKTTGTDDGGCLVCDECDFAPGHEGECDCDCP